ncbi:MAG TPA: phage tail protein, partial [Bacteroidia bacterium]|nr:phage tail protein [Bacteroidia bacterium]
GTVIGYGGREIIPDTLWWLKCDGAACAVSSYQNLNDAILYNYGGDGITVFNVPELRGYFLRGTSHLTGRDPDAANRFAINTGGNTGDMIGSAEFYATGTPTALAISEDGAHTHNRTLVPQTNHHAAYGASGFAAYNTMEWTDNATTSSTDGAHGHSIIGGDKETRPRNIYADFYIANEDMAASAPPIGSIMSFGGDTSDIGVILSLAKIGWLACDGSSVRIDQYRALYDVIGTTFGASPLKFSLPDLRGFFAIGAGEIKLGTQQLVSKAGTPNNPIITSTSQNHQHTMDNLPTDTHVIDVVAGWNLAENNTNGSPTSSNGAHTHVITGGDKESRPINVNVDYIIRYQ